MGEFSVFWQVMVSKDKESKDDDIVDPTTTDL